MTERVKALPVLRAVKGIDELLEAAQPHAAFVRDQ